MKSLISWQTSVVTVCVHWITPNLCVHEGSGVSDGRWKQFACPHTHTHTMVAENHITADVRASVTAVYRGTEPRLRHHISFFWKALFIWRHVQLICDMGCSQLCFCFLYERELCDYIVFVLWRMAFIFTAFAFFRFLWQTLFLSARFLHSFLLNILTRSWIFIQAPPPPSCVKGQMCCERWPAHIHPKIKN